MAVTEPSGTEMLLVGWQAGEDGARDRLIARLHPELAQIAAARLRVERDASLSTGDLINDAVLRLMRLEGAQVVDRNHFMALASRMMRNILVDHARAKGADRRRHRKVELCTEVDGGQRLDLIRLDSALMRLGVIDPQLVELVEMRFFGGMSVPDVAAATGLAEITVKRRWQAARAWLADCLSHPVDDL